MNVIGHYFIFQIKKNNEKAQEGLFMNSSWHEKNNRPITVSNYDLVYGGALVKGMTLDSIYYRFNAKRPTEFKGHTLSNSDVIVTVVGMEQKCFYVDDIGFKEVPTFLDAWFEYNVELAFHIGDRYLCLQTSSEGGYNYDILWSASSIYDGGVNEDDSISALVVVNEIIMTDLKADLPKYGEPGFNPTASVQKGSVTPMDDLVPCNYADFEDRDYDKDYDKVLVFRPDELYRGMVLEQFRKKTAECYNGKPILYEFVPEGTVEEALDDLFNGNSSSICGLSVEELEATAKAYVEEVFQDTGLTVNEVVLVGSRSRALHQTDSDCDFLVEYTGSMKEDGVFNLLNHEKKQICGVTLDFNPFREEESGPLELHLLKADEYLKKKHDTYFCVYWNMQYSPNESHHAFCRAYDEADALKFASTVLDLNRVHITDVTPVKKHMITRQSITFNCDDVKRELEKEAVF